MGIYLGQLPPAEIARLKAELAETLIANFSYPRFFDHRTESLQMRPVDRAKRQEVWLYLSSVDFTAWSRIDLMSADFQHQIERLFIQFVQRNRSLFGRQGRRRMFDIRVSISSCAASVAQGLRNHLTGQKSNALPFGSPRPVISWSTPHISGHAELNWEQIAASTMTLQQQLQELRGEVKPVPVSDGRTAAVGDGVAANYQPSPMNGGVSTGSGRRASSQLTHSAPPAPVTPAARADINPLVVQQPTVSMPPIPAAARTGQLAEGVSHAASGTRGRSSVGSSPSSVAFPATPTTGGSGRPVVDKAITASRVASAGAVLGETISPPGATPASASAVSSRRNGPPNAQANSLSTGTSGPREMMTVAEDDIAIFEQMRHQLVVWLRVEAVTAGLEIANQGPAQLLELLRQQGSIDETRLQVVSTLLNLANQVIKTGLVSVLDYKQALMFHLMHTRR